MSYYFPFGGVSSTSIQNISYSLFATTASVPFSTTVIAISASHSPIVKFAPPVGQNGTNATTEFCEANPPTLISGSTGDQGPTGSKGANNVTCPENSIRCTALEVSLSAGYSDPGKPYGANYYVPSGSQYSIVCMEIPPGCSAGSSPLATCPDYLPFGTWPTIPKG